MPNPWTAIRIPTLGKKSTVASLIPLQRKKQSLRPLRGKELGRKFIEKGAKDYVKEL